MSAAARRRSERLLRDELDALDHALQAFDDPVVDDMPGLRLMRDAVRRKRDDMREKLDKAEACRLDVVVGGAAVNDRGVDVALLTSLTTATVTAVRKLAASLAPHATAAQVARAVELRVEGVPDEGRGVRLRAPDGDIRASVTDKKRRPVVEAAIEKLVAGDGADDLHAVAERSAATVRLVFHVPFGEPKEGELT